MVVLSSFLIHVIADGIVYSFGVFLPVFVHHFDSGRGEVSWVGSLQPAVTYTVGPLASALTNRYGCRTVTIVGAVISTIGFSISYFARNLYFLYFSSGIVAGLGFGLIYLPAIVSVAQYFEKRRSFATGLAVCGSGFGTFLLAPATEQLLQEYGWRGAMLILGGVILNVVVCGGVMRPLEGKPLIVEEDEPPGEDRGQVEAGQLPAPGKKDPTEGDCPETEALLGNGDAETEGVQDLNPEAIMLTLEDLLTDAPRSGKTPSALPAHVTQGVKFHSHHHLAPPSSNGVAAPVVDGALLAMSDGALHQKNGNVHHRRDPGFLRQTSASSSASVALRPVGRKDVFYTASLQHIPMFVADHDMYITSITSLHDETDTGVGEDRSKVCGLSVPSEFAEALAQMMDFSLLRNPVFLLFAISNFFTSIGFNMPFMFLPDRAILAGISERNAAWLLSAIGISNTVGRVVFGYMADLKSVNRQVLYSVALVICGAATALSPFVGGNYILLMIYAAIFGMFIGVYVSLTSVVLVDLLGIELLTNSFGLLLLFQGFATFIGPPLAGWMCDWTGSYDISFNVMGTLIAVSGAMLFWLPCVQRRYELRAPPEEIIHRIDMGALSSMTDINIAGEEEMQLKSL